MRTVILFALLFGTMSAGAAESLSIKGITVETSVQQLRLQMPALKCSRTTGDALHSTCANEGGLPEQFATYAGIPVVLWGAHANADDLVSVMVVLRAQEAPALRALLEEKYGSPSVYPSDRRANLVWERSGARLSLGETSEGQVLLSLWDIAAFDAVVEERRRQLSRVM
jgi:hypothetical protein